MIRRYFLDRSFLLHSSPIPWGLLNFVETELPLKSENSAKALVSSGTTAAKSGVIIVAAVIIAAGYAVYENREQLREFVDRSRRKISMVMHAFADDIMPSERDRQHQPQREMMMHRGRTPPEALRTPSRRGPDADETTLNGGEDETYEKAEGTGHQNFMGNSIIRHRSQHRGHVDEDEHTVEPGMNPF